MKVIAVLLCSAVALASAQVGPINWEIVRPIWQTPGFLDRFPLLRSIITTNPDQSNGFINNGHLAGETQFPWSVGLIFHMGETDGWCSGTLLTPDWILTAAHCGVLNSTGIAMAGSPNIRNTNNPELQRVTFSTVMLMPFWNPNNSLNNDLALVRVDTPFTLSNTVQPARLARRRDREAAFLNQQSIVSGWGSVTPWVSQQMRFLRNQIMGRFACTLGFPGMTGPMHICTSGAVNAPCQGDSGAAITVQEADTEQTVVGVLSFGSALGCSSTRPAVYTLVGPYFAWINQITGVVLRD